ncbi:MAG: tripartite tricarboxylate transporter permease [Candidatus Tectomicrobia bacterium]|uniref:Tripartite tricarboxylate transporter permease n=1 Tax=Tectimicrobiota bacterium TaxID=2528274 RepID=A0A932LZ91_UNCTE|nr:tripartite tricarboxylate transporter permease [Candidatus Tectomicrobia bacterium]
MIEAFLNGMVNPFDPTILPYFLMGIALSLTLGFLPGIAVFHILAVLLPVAVILKPMQGLTFLVASTSVGATGGSIASVLFNIPGDSSNAATLLDGYPMTLKGQAGRAMGIALAASGLGGKISRGNALRGLIPGLLGILLAMIGLDGFSGDYRFTFGTSYLMDGLPLVPVFLGIFALPQVIDLAAGASGAALSKVIPNVTFREVFAGTKETFRHWWLFIRSLLLGVWFGVLPGIGAGGAIWVAYAHAKQTSKRPEEFGTGRPEGILAPETVNNACTGGDLLTTLVFGIPGSATMAFLLGAFLLAGIQPGPGMIYEHLELSFTLLWTVAWANVIGVIVCLILTTRIVRLAYLSPKVLAPIILALVLIATFVGSDEDLTAYIILFAIAPLGYAMMKLDYNRASFVLGFVLGELAERSFQLALQTRGPLFPVNSPISAILTLILLTVIFQRQLGRLFRALRRRIA